MSVPAELLRVGAAKELLPRRLIRRELAGKPSFSFDAAALDILERHPLTGAFSWTIDLERGLTADFISVGKTDLCFVDNPRDARCVVKGTLFPRVTSFGLACVETSLRDKGALA